MPDAARALFMEAAWGGFIRWASQEPEALARYRTETGRTFPPAPPKNGLEAAIDQATGYHKDAAEHFAIWATEALWGIDDAPQKLRERIAELRGGGAR